MIEVLANRLGSGEAVFSRRIEQKIEWLRPVRVEADDQFPAKTMPDEIVEIPLFQTFQSIAARHSDRIAADDGHLRLTYGQMLQAAERIASRLAGIREGGPVGVLLPASAWFPVAMLACLAARRMVVPIDLHYPPARNAAIIRDAHLAGVIVRGEDGLQALSIPDDVRRVDIADIPLASSPDDDAGPLLPDRDAEPGLPVDAPAIVLYTSGSTGAPKGIVNNQRAILQRVLQHVNASRISERDGLLPLSSPCTVAGVREIFAALLSGATLHLLDPQRAGLNGIRRAIRENGITICYAVPALLRSLLAADEGQADLPSLRVVRLGGDRILLSDVQLLREALPRCRIQIAYSSTETTGTQWFVPPDFATAAPSMPVGYVLPGISYAILGDDGASVPTGEIGELVIRSRFVALGLWEGGSCVPRVQRPAPQHPGEWIFPTGDLVSVAPDGLVSMFGRKDRQVKIRGQRVEPAELEAVLRRAPEVVDVAVIARRMDGDAVLVAFVTSRRTDAEALIDRLNASVRSSLPSALHPAAIHVLGELPRLPSNKVDTGRLLEIDETSQAHAHAAPPPLAPAVPARPTFPLAEQVEAAVLRAWQREAGARSLADNQSWADAGGNSLKLLRLIFELEEALGRSLPVHLFRAEMRASDFIAAITASLAEASSREDPRPKLFLFPGVNGDDPQLAAFRGDLDDMTLPVTIRYPGWEEMLAPGYRFDDLLGAIMLQIDADPSEGPIRLAGYSLGGVLAFAAAEVLLARGREVGFLGILDSSLAHAPMMMRRGAMGMIRRMTRMPSFVWRGSVEDNLARVAAHYLSSPKAWPLLRRLLTRGETGPFSGLRFALHYWSIRFRRANLTWDWLRERQRPPISARAVLFRAAEAVVSGPPDLGWSALCPNLRVVEVPGAHLTMLQTPNRPTVAARFREALAYGSG